MTDQTEDTRRVRIAYDPNDLKRAGSVVDLPVDDARQLIREGRAAETDDDLFDSTNEAEVAAHVAGGRTRAELAELAEAHGVMPEGKPTKAQLVDALTAAGVDPA